MSWIDALLRRDEVLLNFSPEWRVANVDWSGSVPVVCQGGMGQVLKILPGGNVSGSSYVKAWEPYRDRSGRLKKLYEMKRG